MNRFKRWRRAGVWDRLTAAVSQAYDGDIQMIDSSSIRVHQARRLPNRRNVPAFSSFLYRYRNLVETPNASVHV